MNVFQISVRNVFGYTLRKYFILLKLWPNDFWKELIQLLNAPKGNFWQMCIVKVVIEALDKTTNQLELRISDTFEPFDQLNLVLFRLVGVFILQNCVVNLLDLSLHFLIVHFDKI